MYPGLRSTGHVSLGGDKPYHIVVNAENFHALETLLYTHEASVDAIYIDPPYNSGVQSWKYNNDYVDAADYYRHSKWLAFMEKRLKLARRLLKPAKSVLMITIDENEVHNLGLLLHQLFPANRVQMITTVTNPKGASLGGDFARVEEHIFIVYISDMVVHPGVSDMLNEDTRLSEDRPVKWSSLIRGGAQGIRTDSPGVYYPVFVDTRTRKIHSLARRCPGSRTGIRRSTSWDSSVWPPTHTSGVEGRWGIGPDKADELYRKGALRLGTVDFEARKFPLSYLSSGIVDKIDTGEVQW